MPIKLLTEAITRVKVHKDHWAGDIGFRPLQLP